MYKNCLIAYLDIVGFTDAIRKADADEVGIESIAAVLKGLTEGAQVIRDKTLKHWKQPCNAVTFSDSIVICFPELSDDSFISMVNIVAALQFDVTSDSFFLRGGVSNGWHYESEGVMFGQAYLKAYELEKLALWPRVVIDPRLLRTFPKKQVDVYLGAFLNRDETGLCYLNYLTLANRHFAFNEVERYKKGEITSPDLTRVPRVHKERLLSAINKVKRTRSIETLMKLHGLAEYHNRFIRVSGELLPETDDLDKLDPSTPAGKFLGTFRKEALQLEGTTEGDVREFLREWVSYSGKGRQQLDDCQIDMASSFKLLYRA